MMTIPCYVSKSKIHGQGLFASEKVKKGDTIWTYNPKVDLRIPKAKVLAWPKDVKEKMDHFAVLAEDDHYILSTDGSRYINHSKNPNVETFGSYGDMVALRDIQANEEITSNYFEFDEVTGKKGRVSP